MRFFYGEDAGLYDADCVTFDGMVYRKQGTGDVEGEVVRLLERLGRRVDRLLWFDTTDGRGITGWECRDKTCRN